MLLTNRTEQALVLLEKGLLIARHVSEIRDVLTARTIAALQKSIECRGLYNSSSLRVFAE
jgi:hypothetical protein